MLVIRRYIGKYYHQARLYWAIDQEYSCFGLAESWAPFKTRPREYYFHIRIMREILSGIQLSIRIESCGGVDHLRVSLRFGLHKLKIYMGSRGAQADKHREADAKNKEKLDFQFVQHS